MTGFLFKLFSFRIQPRTFRFSLLQPNFPVVRPIVSFELIFTDEASGRHLVHSLRFARRWKVSVCANTCCDFIRFSETGVSSNLSLSWINFPMNLWQPIFRLTNIESKLSVLTSALPERESGDSIDQFSGSVKNFLPSPFVLSSLLSLVWWNKSTTKILIVPNFFQGLNKLNMKQMLSTIV